MDLVVIAVGTKNVDNKSKGKRGRHEIFILYEYPNFSVNGLLLIKLEKKLVEVLVN